jgi:hypothetical protein
MPRKVFVAGEILTAADVNTNLMDQAVMSFAGTAARGSAIPTPVEGMVTYLNDADRLEVYTNDWKPVGSILQVVSTTKTDTFSTASTSFVDVTGLTASITPSSTSSKVLVSVSVPTSVSSSQAVFLTLADGSNNNLVAPTSPGSRTPSFVRFSLADQGNIVTSGFELLHSPATTSSVTYKVRMRLTGGTGYVNRADVDTDNSTFARSVATITLMEVAD